MYDCHDGWDGAFWDVALSESGIVHDSFTGKSAEAVRLCA